MITERISLPINVVREFAGAARAEFSEAEARTILGIAQPFWGCLGDRVEAGTIVGRAVREICSRIGRDRIYSSPRFTRILVTIAQLTYAEDGQLCWASKRGREGGLSGDEPSPKRQMASGNIQEDSDCAIMDAL